MPTISVIVPVYNVEKYLARCLDSILNQTFTDFEVICVNDGSKDTSLAILEQYAQKDTRLAVINQENQGQSVARNVGIAVAKGDFITFVDADDGIVRQTLEIAYGLALKYSVEMVAWDMLRVTIPSFTAVHMPPIAPDALQNSFDIESIEVTIADNLFPFYHNQPYRISPAVWGRLYDKNLMSSLHFVEGCYFEDTPYTWDVMLKRPKTAIINEALYMYFCNSSSITQQLFTPKHIMDAHKTTNIIYERLINLNSSYEMDTFINKEVRRILNVQSRLIPRNSIADQKALWLAFETELRDFQAKNILPPPDSQYRSQDIMYTHILEHGAQHYYENNILKHDRKPFPALLKRRTQSAS
ncbi:MAG: glycosyltransferase [Pseudomonadota bacterium]